ncbi:MAG: DUF4832 domain-containing protein [Bacteroidota bacterium]
MKYKIRIFFFLIVVISYAGCSDTDEDNITEEPNIKNITYQISNEVISNPERGFMHTWPVYSEGNAMNVSLLTSLKNENVTLILRLYYLENFKDTSLSQTQLDLIKTDFERLRDAGIKCVLRFAYTDQMDGTDAPYNIIELHLDQLKPLITDNADVIAFVQAGFIGSWGEWYYSSNGLTTVENKTLILNKLLEVFPKEIKIQVRTPLYKQEIFEYSTAIESSVGYGTTDIARVGFHNDCFLASVDDYGTYQNIDQEKRYISNEALFVPTGGETCPPSGVPTASCTIAENEMTLLKWTYLNLDYYGPVLQEWRNNNCFVDFQKKIGYRFSLESSSLPKEVNANGTFKLNAIINNSGYAPIYRVKNTFLVFRSIENNSEYNKKLNFDIRHIIPKVSFQLTESVNISGIPSGKYELLLKIEDTSEKISDRPEYCIRLANSTLWEEAKGINKLLHTVTIN